MHAFVISVLLPLLVPFADPVPYDVGAAFTGALGTAMGYVALIIPAGLLIWVALFSVGIGKKAAKKASA